ncbi:hypothetical protein C4579_00765 [Candidatus Microgenomates bacterium]|nr:MAG: hypothetical protein C4579_00765 [Candidatus Microgenomates bacterium]
MNKVKSSRNFFSKKNIFFLIAFLIFQIIFLIIVRPVIINLYLLSESHFEPQPEIDTVFTPNFTKENFEKIQNGMTTQEVRDLLGEPFRTENIKILEVENRYARVFQAEDNAECWRYSQDGKLGDKADFSWYSYRVCFEDNQLYLKLIEEFFD